MQINWTVLTYFVIGLFALNGFFRGWWKEAFTTGFLVLLVFLLAQPAFADDFIALVNTVMQTVWGILPREFTAILRDSFQTGLGISTASTGITIDPADGNTWLILLVVFIGAATLVSRVSLPDHGPGGGYAVRPMGSILGGLVGGLNGLVIINLVREYLDGRNLPGGGALSGSLAQSAGGGAVRMASSGVSVQAVEVPNFTILDSYLPWIIIIFGLLIFLAALKNRVGVTRQNGFSKVNYKEPLGYRKY
jgi:hypothetical protein